MSHTAGRKSFARIRASEKMKRSGLDISRAEMFRLTHIKKNQQPVDLKSAEILMHGMQQTIEEMTSQIQTMQSTIKNLQAFNVKQPTMLSALFKSASECSQKQSHLNMPSSSTQLNMAMQVDLLSFEAPGEVVAQGRVVSKDPNKDVGGFKFGPHFWEVYVEIAIRKEEFLIRPRGHFSTIKEVVGSTIA
ncbi:hypothetical protein BUALT_Bualt07G0023200 [Buddleja alternifolia]|uniref:Transposase Tnp1/En/Spm-like domain-containing protein n=1 Tax=Buddleja alternifolia TaxID=168488 RepID=A0AAV6X6R2_9LAMI|nr:hypothetical protein BUALT_Bualt07G0023200 [Buddleja alternifolia]